MIPKIVHYCWFSNIPFGDVENRCIHSWNLYLEGYENRLWDYNSIPFEKYPFLYKFYDQKKWAIISDIVRLHALQENGGWYFDLDFQLISHLDKIYGPNCFGFEGNLDLISAHAMGATSNNFVISKSLDFLIDWYGGNEDVILLPQVIAYCIRKYEPNISILNPSYFPTNPKNIGTNTLGLHYSHGAWIANKKSWISYVQFRLLPLRYWPYLFCRKILTGVKFILSLLH